MYSNFHSDFKDYFLFFMRLSAIACMSFSLSCGGTNLFNQSGNPDTEQALLEDALKYINKGDYDKAITALDKITSSFRGTPRVVKAIVGAYAGKCGLNFIDFVNGMAAASGSTPMLLFMRAFKTVTVFPSYCDSAQTVIETYYGTNSGTRPTDINFFMAVLGMTKVGTYLRSIADKDQDGLVDATFTSACLNTPPNILDAQVKEVGSGIGLVLNNFTAMTAQLSGNAAITFFNTLTTVCGAPCLITDPNSSSWTAGAILTVRRVLQQNQYGIMPTCADPTLVTCC